MSVHQQTQPGVYSVPSITAALQALSCPELDAVYARALDCVTLTHYAGRSDNETGFWRSLTRAIYGEREARRLGATFWDPDVPKEAAGGVR